MSRPEERKARYEASKERQAEITQALRAKGAHVADQLRASQVSTVMRQLHNSNFAGWLAVPWLNFRSASKIVFRQVVDFYTSVVRQLREEFEDYTITELSLACPTMSRMETPNRKWSKLCQ